MGLYNDYSVRLLTNLRHAFHLVISSQAGALGVYASSLRQGPVGVRSKRCSTSSPNFNMHVFKAGRGKFQCRAGPRGGGSWQNGHRGEGGRSETEVMAVVCAEQNFAHGFPSGNCLLSWPKRGLHLQLPHLRGKVLAWESRPSGWLCRKLPARRLGRVPSVEPSCPGG